MRQGEGSFGIHDFVLMAVGVERRRGFVPQEFFPFTFQKVVHRFQAQL